MPKRGGKRVQIKKLKYQIKQLIISSQNPFLLLLKLKSLELEFKRNTNKIRENIEYKLIPLEFEINYPNYLLIDKTDPRYQTYKLRFLFGKN